MGSKLRSSLRTTSLLRMKDWRLVPRSSGCSTVLSILKDILRRPAPGKCTATVGGQNSARVSTRAAGADRRGRCLGRRPSARCLFGHSIRVRRTTVARIYTESNYESNYRIPLSDFHSDERRHRATRSLAVNLRMVGGRAILSREHAGAPWIISSNEEKNGAIWSCCGIHRSVPTRATSLQSG